MQKSDWIRSADAARLFGVDVRTLPKLADANGIRMLRLAGQAPRYSRRDIKAALARAIVAPPAGHNAHHEADSEGGAR